MKTLFSIAALALITGAAQALPVASVPSAEILPLLGAGLAAVALATRRRNG